MSKILAEYGVQTKTALSLHLTLDRVAVIETADADGDGTEEEP